jgi:hypothetical protein
MIIKINYPVVLTFDRTLTREAKAAGAEWNADMNQWEARNPVALFKCNKWAPANQRLGVLWQRECLNVPPVCVSHAIMYNARYDEKCQCWYDPYGSPGSTLIA